MAKLALINREQKRADLVAKFAPKRAALKAIIDDQSKTEEERYEARLKLQALPRNSAPTRQRNRCASRAVHVAHSVNSVWVASSSVNSPCVVKFRV